MIPFSVQTLLVFILVIGSLSQVLGKSSQLLGELSARRQRQEVIKIKSSQEFFKYMIHSPRNYTALVLFTTQQNTKCWTCRFSEKVIHYFASEYTEQFQMKEASQLPLFFVQVNVENLRSLFKKLEITTLPTFLHIPEIGKLSNIKRYDNQIGLQNVVLIRDFIARVTNQQVLIRLNGLRLPEDSSYTTTELVWMCLALSVICVFFIYITLRIYRECQRRTLPQVLDIRYYANLIMLFTTTLIAGHVYNYVEGPPWAGSSYFSAGASTQFVSEAYLVTLIYFGIAIGMLKTIEGRRKLLLKSQGGTTDTVAGVALMSCMCLVLLVAAGIKGGYDDDE